MKFKGTLLIVAGIAGCVAALSQQPAAPQRNGPGVQAPQDSRYAAFIANCKTAPPARGGKAGGGGAPKGGQGKGPGAAPAAERDTTVKAIPGVIAAGQQWKELWTVNGNNADGIIGTADGGLLVAQNDNSAVVKIDREGKSTVMYSGLNTTGSVNYNSKGALFALNRGLNQSIEQLAPEHKLLADRINSDPLDCIGGVLNDMTADSKGGVYFTAGTVFYAAPSGTVTRYGENLGTNGIALSADEKRLFVTNGATVAVFDVGADGALTNQREFAKLEGGGGGDGMTFDTLGRLYVTAGAGVHVLAADGKYLGLIPTPRGVISATFSGADRKTLYVVSRDNALNKDWILGIQMIATGPLGRRK